VFRHDYCSQNAAQVEELRETWLEGNQLLVEWKWVSYELCCCRHCSLLNEKTSLEDSASVSEVGVDRPSTWDRVSSHLWSIQHSRWQVIQVSHIRLSSSVPDAEGYEEITTIVICQAHCSPWC